MIEPQQKPHPLGATGTDILYVVDLAWSEGWGRAMTAGRLHVALPEHTRAALMRSVNRLRHRGLVVYQQGNAIRLTAAGRRWLEANGYPPEQDEQDGRRDSTTTEPDMHEGTMGASASTRKTA